VPQRWTSSPLLRSGSLLHPEFPVVMVLSRCGRHHDCMIAPALAMAWGISKPEPR
jgi:hypothetical protein